MKSRGELTLHAGVGLELTLLSGLQVEYIRYTCFSVSICTFVQVVVLNSAQ